MKKYLLLFLIIITIKVQVVSALTIDLWSQFPDNQGDNGFYAYAYNPETESYRLIPDDGERVFKTPGQPWQIPLTYRYIESNTNQPWIFMHPASIPQCGNIYGTEDIVLAFSVPENNFYDLTGSFWVSFSGYTDGYINPYIKKNNTLLFSDYLSLGQVVNYNLSNISLNKNDYLYFGISSAGPDYSDWGNLQGQISYNPVLTPEPSAMVLLGSLISGLFGFTGLRRRLTK